MMAARPRNGAQLSYETAIFITDAQRRAILQNIFSTFYAEMPKGDVVFDTNRCGARGYRCYRSFFRRPR